MQAIAQLEGERRGPYAGAVGYFSPDRRRVRHHHQSRPSSATGSPRSMRGRGSSPTRCRSERRPRWRRRRHPCWPPSEGPRHEGLPARQLRLVHLQRRPAAGPHRRRCHRRAQRRSHRRRGRGAQRGRDRHLAGAVAAGERGHQRGAGARLGPIRADPGGLPRPPGDRRRVRRGGDPRAAGAWQGSAGAPRRHGLVRGPALAVRRRRATTRWRSRATRCRTSWRSPPGPRTAW